MANKTPTHDTEIQSPRTSSGEPPSDRQSTVVAASKAPATPPPPAVVQATAPSAQPSPAIDTPAPLPSTNPQPSTVGYMPAAPVVAAAPQPVISNPQNPEAQAAAMRERSRAKGVAETPPGLQDGGTSKMIPGDVPTTPALTTQSLDARAKKLDEARSAGFVAVSSIPGTFRRSGMSFTQKATILRVSELSDEALASIVFEPSLKVETVTAEQAERIAYDTEQTSAPGFDNRGVAELRVALAAAERERDEAKQQLAYRERSDEAGRRGHIRESARVSARDFKG